MTCPLPSVPRGRYMSSQEKPSAAADKQMREMWRRQARQKLDGRLSAAAMLKDEGNALPRTTSLGDTHML